MRTPIPNVVLCLTVSGCLDRPVEPVEPRTTAVVSEILGQSRVDKIDILLAIDNSRSMADKQEILATTVPDLVERLVNPYCVDPAGQRAASQPATPGEKCALGTKREFDPILDIHIGIVSSSLGGYGATLCPTTDAEDKTNDDRGHLVARLDAMQAGVPAPTYDDKGFLAWDPARKYDPPGELVLNDGAGKGLVPALADMVRGVGQIGCGYEAQLESMYRFLVDTEPYDAIQLEPDPAQGLPTAKLSGLDEVLLRQRADFLRPDSLLAIIMLTDENDCSMKVGGQYWVAANHTPLWRPRKECSLDPNDKCCLSCAADPGDCPPDPECYDADSHVRVLSEQEDPVDLRCFDQKRRFGAEFLYPVERYVAGLRDKVIPNRAGQMVDNPIYADLDPHDELTNVRSSDLVFFAGIIGVPWQDIARDPTDLEKGFKNATELGEPDGLGTVAWDVILGDPAAGIGPTDPLMTESVGPRTGTQPVLGEAIAPASSPSPYASSINGHEYHTQGKNLEYACIFDLPLPHDCTGLDPGKCDCVGNTALAMNPLCQASDGTYTSTQFRAKAYPGVRQLQVLKGLGEQGIVASACPAQLATNDADFGYRPAVEAIIERLKNELVGGQCLPRTLSADEDGNVSCLMVEVRKTDDCAAACSQPGRTPVTPIHQPAVDAAFGSEAARDRGWNCACEVPQLSGAERTACQTKTDEQLLAEGAPDGWCYIDATTTPQVGSAELVASCKESERRMVRFVGQAEVTSGGTMFITCAGE